MFTGLVQATGIVRTVRRVGTGAARAGRRPTRTSARDRVRLAIDPGAWAHHPREGDSICVDGVCLTLVEAPLHRLKSRQSWAFDVVPQTLSLTTLGTLKVGQRVNLEHAATLGTFLGGHIVQGHVDGRGRVVSVQRVRADWRLRIALPDSDPDLADAVVPRGSITVNGVSLTIAGVWSSERTGERGFEVALIPVTLDKTNLGSLKRGREVNIEVDLIAKTAAAVVRRMRPPARPTPRSTR